MSSLPALGIGARKSSQASGKDVTGSVLVEPPEFRLAQGENAVENEFTHMLGMGLGIGERQRASPGSTEGQARKRFRDVPSRPPCHEPGATWCWPRAKPMAWNGRNPAGRTGPRARLRDRSTAGSVASPHLLVRREGRRRACLRGCRIPRNGARGPPRPPAGPIDRDRPVDRASEAP